MRHAALDNAALGVGDDDAIAGVVTLVRDSGVVPRFAPADVHIAVRVTRRLLNELAADDDADVTVVVGGDVGDAHVIEAALAPAAGDGDAGPLEAADVHLVDVNVIE